MKRILIVTSYYLPGYKAGGPIRSIANMVAALGDEYEFSILTADRDHNETQPYPGIKTGMWQTVGKARVMYLPPAQQRFIVWRSVLQALEYDVLYLNGLFDSLTIKSLMLRRMRGILSTRTIVAPRGHLAKGALGLKGYKKGPFVKLTCLLGLYREIQWHAASELESSDIREQIPSAITYVAPNHVSEAHFWGVQTKKKGQLKIIFLSRVARKKNLDVVLLLLQDIKGTIELDIFGPLEDPDYWQECQRRIDTLPSNVRVNYGGVIAQDRVIPTCSGYHLFFLPTRSENFGHVIAEALASGCPVLTSDQTPWRGLAAVQAGWDLPLSEQRQFKAVLEKCVAMDQSEFNEWSAGARVFFEKHSVNQSELSLAYCKLFDASR